MDNLITLTMNEQHRYSIAKRLIEKKISEKEARRLMGLKSVRQVRRIRKRVVENGIKGVIHKSRGKPSNRKYSDEFIEEVVSIVTEKYSDFKPTFASEKLLESHDIRINKETLRQLMTEEC